MSCFFKPSKHLRFLIFGSLIAFALHLSAPTALAEEDLSPTDSVGNVETKKYNISFSMNIDGLFFGFYKNLTSQRGDTASPLDLHSALGVYGEMGFGFRSFGVYYYLDAVWSPPMTYLDDQGYNHGAHQYRHGIRAYCQISHRTFNFNPEAGYVFINEDAYISDPEGNKSDILEEKHTDANYNYGLSGRIKLIPIRKGGLWLYGRYVHDDLDIKADNYWIEFQAGGINPEPPWIDKDRPYVESGYFTLGVRWTKKTDGRSDWFLTLGFSGSLGLLSL